MKVERIPPPSWATKTAVRFFDQYTKLLLWNMTQFDAIVYLDADTIVMNDLKHLHELVSNPRQTHFEFAAAVDSWYDKWIMRFNAGVLVLHPSELVFNELIRLYRMPHLYDAEFAEQELLNQFFRLRYLQLPPVYNTNIALYLRYPKIWKVLKPDFKVVHFTKYKPFLKRNTWSYNEPDQLYRKMWETITVNISEISKKYNIDF